MKSMIDQQMLINLESQDCQQEFCVHEKKSDKAIDIANKHQFINKRVWMIETTIKRTKMYAGN